MDKINLYVDDLRLCPKNFQIARTFDEAVTIIKNHPIKILSLDHDLGENEKGELLLTGYDLVKYICSNPVYIEEIYLHTDNPVGRENMFQTLVAAQKRGFIHKNIRIFRYPYSKSKY